MESEQDSETLGVKRDDSDKYTTTCLHKLHKSSYISGIVSNTKVKKNIRNYIETHDLMNSERVFRICHECYQTYLDDNPEKSSNRKRNYKTANPTKIFDEKKDDIKRLKDESSIKNIDYMLGYDADEWLKDRPANLLSFLEKLTNTDVEDQDSKLKIAFLVEHLYSCINDRLVLPFSFRQNLLFYSFSRSRRSKFFFRRRLPASLMVARIIDGCSHLF